ncbi:succinate dehydrogenase cytochrome b560 subunit, mitochondrial-like [Microplitis mediator]|uniref:succinate dehydrogenase cytochrome b560 subunit, mitochondrial-like n=1 Tax=Microplitis mediator TaxID=375433 RepID=UPI0025528692|nr:succinate dehydrogenase cytochrome b560 subunit, mitochondrial-like [Microplitis mediator]
MALNYTRLLCKKNLDVCQFRGLFKTTSLNISSTISKSAAVTSCETHSERNHRLKRPLSPHLSIYKPQLTSMLSITHRGTGIALAYYATAAGLTELFHPGGMSCLIESINSIGLPMPLLFLGKLMLAWPATYHYFNGIRHLSWDLGLFLTIKHVYSTGYTVLGTSVITAFILAAMF